jgi:peptide/nickel transport system ATP-binding protein/oligopeptide transport system ATP-binding protein
MTEPLLQIRDLSVSFATDEGTVRAVDGVSLDIRRGEVLGLVGESGCGKSVTAMSVLRLIPSPPGRIDAGSARFEGRDLLRMPVDELRDLRGSGISMIFQEPMTALSPLHRVGKQLVEALRLHKPLSAQAAWTMARDWLGKVGIPDPDERMFAYPFQLSGGMRQRVMIAMALMLDPALVIADEPTTALDVTIQAQIFDLMRAMRKRETALMLITHDMGVIWEMCTRVAVMYASEIVETGDLQTLFANPLHPYTEALLASIPALAGRGRRLESIRGQVPSPLRYPAGCRFCNRCKYAFDRCRADHPALETFGNAQARCFLAGERARRERKHDAAPA